MPIDQSERNWAVKSTGASKVVSSTYHVKQPPLFWSLDLECVILHAKYNSPALLWARKTAIEPALLILVTYSLFFYYFPCPLSSLRVIRKKKHNSVVFHNLASIFFLSPTIGIEYYI